MKNSLLLNVLICIHLLTFITKALHLVAAAGCSFLPYSSWLVLMMSCVSKAMPIHFINSKCHIKQLKSGKSCKTCLINHTQSISHHFTPIAINGLGDRHTYRHMNQSNFKKPSEHQPAASACLV